ncbi:Fasciclin-like arabinogalactan protein [Colletotrichum orbiculare MAFF 240422]|uniref:Fasciclin-like arabinogalactan protein n=1 Tax=Colletotrichum orbiculare (strain 104-T / ATCC 96160 / CBS 514.97 / LARS 414 / MAFF 240422) TaxID=1213857 RepID=N4VFY6_COLOR|nr:Fasciclin-like arabinogalactan protein [Colletotrichum orbiculare MAFF 240422]
MTRPTSLAPWVMAFALMLLAPTAEAQKLDDVLAKQANLTTFRGLVKDHGDIFSNLPTSGVTILAPSDQAYLRAQTWAADPSAVPGLLAYGILGGRIAFDDLRRGHSALASTLLLTDPRSANVTAGQNVLVTKQPGGDVVVTSGVAQRATAVATDLAFEGGLVQVVDAVAVVPARQEPTVRGAYTDLSAFLGALYAAGVVEEFAGDEDVTIFAPRNAAFQQVASAMQGLGEEELRRVLRYHVVPGKVVGKSALANGTRYETGVEEKKVRVRLHNNDIFVDSARVIQTDILIANGVVQVLGAVLNVEADGINPNVTAATQAPVFTVTGTVETGTQAPTPFVSALPCTTGCPVSGGAGTGRGGGGDTGGSATGVVSPSSSTGGAAAAAAARCTAGVVGAAAAAGVAGLSWAVGVLGMEGVGVV